MAQGKAIDRTVRTEVLTKIRDQGMSVAEASRLYGINKSSIYTWLQDKVVDGSANLILENNRLKKELEQAYSLLGRATAELKRPKR